MPFQDVGTRGYWDAATNFPPLKSGRGENGASYQVSVAGSTEIDGISDWRVGDLILFMNDTWTRVPGKTTAEIYGSRTETIQFLFDGGGSPIVAGYKNHIKIPFACTILSWELSADASGSIVIDIWKDVLANFPLTVADSIVASAKPTLASVAQNSSSTLTGWNTTIAAGDYLGFRVDSAATVQVVNLVLNVRKG